MKKIISFLLIVSMFQVFGQNKTAKDLALEVSNKFPNISMDELVGLTNRNINDSIEKAKFIYYWMGINIKYDHELLEKMNSSNFNYDVDYKYNTYPRQVMIKRKAVCYGYSVLYKWFMEQFGIKTEIVTGHIRDERNHYIELVSDSDFSHAWNAIKIDKRWRLVDSTWGTTNDSNISDYYFDTDPNKIIFTHFPEESKWQLLEKPLTLEEFNVSKFITPIWFENGFTDNPKMKKDENFYYFIYKSNPDPNWEAYLEYSIDNFDFQPIKDTKTIKQDGYTYLKFSRKELPEVIYFKVNILYFEGVRYIDVINFKVNK